MELRPYQIQLRTEIRGRFRAGRKRVLAVSPTGSGKTVLFSSIVAGSYSLGKKVVVVAHRREILDQISAALTRFDVQHGFIQAGMSPTRRAVMVASIQTLAGRLEDTPRPDFIVVDEAHHGVSSQYLKMFSFWSDVPTLGVTATPERLDGTGLGHVFEDMVVGPQVSWLIEQGNLARPVYFAPPKAISMVGVRKIAGDYSKSDSEELVNTKAITGDVIAHYRKYLHGRLAVAFCISVAHCEAVAQQFRAAGIPAGCIDGTMSKEQRAGILTDLREGRIKVLTSCELISEGFDLPAVNGAILLRPTASLILHLQQIGRALRPKSDGSDAIILDHVGNCLRHGLAETAREWSLEGAERRKKKEGEAEPLPKQCRQCFAIFSGSKCQQCGFVSAGKGRTIEEQEGELQKLEANRLTIERKNEERSCRTFEDWESLAKARGYKPGWAVHQFKLREKFRKIREGGSGSGVERAIAYHQSLGLPG